MSLLKKVWEYITPRKTPAKVDGLEDPHQHPTTLATPLLSSKTATVITPSALNTSVATVSPTHKVVDWQLGSTMDTTLSPGRGLKRQFSSPNSAPSSYRKKFRFDSALSEQAAQPKETYYEDLEATGSRFSEMSFSNGQEYGDSGLGRDADDQLPDGNNGDDEIMIDREDEDDDEVASSENEDMEFLSDEDQDELGGYDDDGDGGDGGDDEEDDDDEDDEEEGPDRFPFANENGDLFEDATAVLSSSSFEASAPDTRRRMVSLPAESAYLAKGVTTAELREKGWDDDHITLVQKLAMRGHEPLLPSWNKFGMRWMPDELFSQNDDDAFISSALGRHSHSEKALTSLFQMGPNVRTLLKPGGRPEQAVVRGVKEYIKWTMRDSQLYQPDTIPIVAIKARPGSTPVDILEAKAKRELERLTGKYRTAFTASPSIEGPMPTTPPPLAYPLPTMYCLVASHTLVALTVYRPADTEPTMQTVAMFDFADKDYDVWNALAIAIILCHQRNIQMRIFEETGLGARPPNWDAVEDDPDA